MSARVIYNARTKRHAVEVVLSPDEAENIAFALGMDDMGARELFDAANEACAMDAKEDAL